MSFPLPKKYYLLVHDAARKVLGTDAEISAFVSSKRKFQCDMLINASATDPEMTGRAGGGGDHSYQREFAVGLQRYLGSCDVVVRSRRLDVVFMDREVLQLALGAPRRAINNLQRGEEINGEPDWTRRNRLRISLGYDEDLFTNVCDLKMNIAARLMEKFVFDTYYNSTYHGSVEQFMQRESPPVTYWQAHGYTLAREYQFDHHVTLAGTIAQNFAKYYGEFAFDNPYCPGEDLNTISSVQWLCKAWKQIPMEDEEGNVRELQLGTKQQPSHPQS
ncbi:hypothetical protein C3747_84g19 [Trypanosoma cruzi]|uniref:Uncharacterized protein n=2 Tax=Trypanosoma cruzi TaxID=5693 RepID=Q4DI57_TRYCC|nr:hypothetical protein, conserved [Trypanosoma cruzi]EAN92205.1 hypothetical protein, conserved [Trypanosoma cruzi]KAF8290683.1 hypothetical protein TcYC6_0128040 [Trypanosoma cruzi]KAF8302672.1 hypothetical protein TcYC6_0046190 [Trypanosoma cruzi]PWV08897.1 hypothetical protein C3747_84g19 [Trypanosoma cruzi]RNC60073.1 hypothetical protein TcCL_ESM02289 [Trypanosoma cruzi]|eukprot:XP_814056.1 hypothetical protein [Trypanosoma cruzi strain CL Brener]